MCTLSNMYYAVDAITFSNVKESFTYISLEIHWHVFEDSWDNFVGLSNDVSFEQIDAWNFTSVV